MAAFAALSACATTPPLPPQAPVPTHLYRICFVWSERPPASLNVSHWTALDSGQVTTMTTWSTLTPPGRHAALFLYWRSGDAPRPPGDSGEVNVAIHDFSLFGRVARLEVRREPQLAGAAEEVIAGNYTRRGYWLFVFVNWSRLRAFAEGAQWLKLSIVARNGRVLAEERLDAALVRQGDADLETAWRRLQDMLRDPARACTSETRPEPR